MGRHSLAVVVRTPVVGAGMRFGWTILVSARKKEARSARDRASQCAVCCCGNRHSEVIRFPRAAKAAACLPQESHLSVAAYSSPHEFKRFTGSPPFRGGSHEA